MKTLSGLCRHGQLFEVQEWIVSGKPYEPATRDRRIFDPFRVAVQTGFHSLIEVFLKAGPAPVQYEIGRNNA